MVAAADGWVEEPDCSLCDEEGLCSATEGLVDAAAGLADVGDAAVPIGMFWRRCKALSISMDRTKYGIASANRTTLAEVDVTSMAKKFKCDESGLQRDKEATKGQTFSEGSCIRVRFPKG